MPKLFQKLIMMHTYFMRSFFLRYLEIAFSAFTKTYSLPWNFTSTEYNHKNTWYDTDYDQHPLLHEPPSCTQHPVS